MLLTALNKAAGYLNLCFTAFLHPQIRLAAFINASYYILFLTVCDVIFRGIEKLKLFLEISRHKKIFIFSNYSSKLCLNKSKTKKREKQG